MSRFGEDCVLVGSLAALDSGYRLLSLPKIGTPTMDRCTKPH